jgi:hypothetical protein
MAIQVRAQRRGTRPGPHPATSPAARRCLCLPYSLPYSLPCGLPQDPASRRVSSSAWRCPPLQKNEGCNKMTCSCGAFWCWKCSKIIEGYEHFRGNSCKLFEDEQVGRGG